MSVLTAVSLFSGCGGSDWGLHELGVNVLWANDVWRPACDVHRLNMPETEVVFGDITKIQNFPASDILIGCYPCQGFSQGGARDPEAKINQLYLEFGRALKQTMPKAFLVENVIGMIFGRNRAILDAQVSLFESIGYRVGWKLLDARDYGMAQERKRVFLVGTRADTGLRYEFPNPSHGEEGQPPRVPQREALRGFPDWPEDGYVDDPLTWYYMSRRRRRDWDEAAPCVVSHYRSVALHPASPPMEYVGPDKYRFKTEGPARRYSYAECAALQGFPAGFKWGDERIATKHRMIGNAVPPPLFKAVAEPVVALLS